MALAMANTDKDWLAWLQKRDKGAEKRKLAKIAAKQGQKWEKEQEMGKWRTEEQEQEEEKCPVKWWSSMRGSMRLHPLYCNTNTTVLQ